MASVIAMSNEKGGVAKTTSTLSLGAALAELGHRVLLIDLDPQANLSLALGLETGEVEMTSASVLIDNTAHQKRDPQDGGQQPGPRSLQRAYRKCRAVSADAQPLYDGASQRHSGGDAAL